MCHCNYHCRAHEVDRKFRKTQSLGYLSAFVGDHCLPNFSHDCKHRRSSFHLVDTFNWHNTLVFCWFMVWMETKESVLSCQHPLCSSDDSAFSVNLSQQYEKCESVFLCRTSRYHRNYFTDIHHSQPKKAMVWHRRITSHFR